MDPQIAVAAENEFVRALAELDKGNSLAALACLERALQLHDNPQWYSRLGFCIARERGHVTKGIELCRKSIELEPREPVHHYYLGRTHLLAGQKKQALEAFRQGMAAGGTPEIEDALMTFGTRRSPLLPWISRSHPINKYAGIIFRRLHLR